jgi:two-component system, NtrC family, response regulator AtoC
MQPLTRPRRVLVVDDEPLLRWSVAETLSDCGFDVVESSDADGARTAVRDAGFDAVLLDLQLPDSSDLSLLRTLHTLSPATPLILMTAFGSPELEHDALALGAYRVVDKPFEIDDLAQVVTEAAASRRPGVFPGAAN